MILRVKVIHSPVQIQTDSVVETYVVLVQTSISFIITYYASRVSS